jgi:hypothetical protein
MNRVKEESACVAYHESVLGLLVVSDEQRCATRNAAQEGIFWIRHGSHFTYP